MTALVTLSTWANWWVKNWNNQPPPHSRDRTSDRADTGTYLCLPQGRRISVRMDYGEYTGIIEARLQADAVVLHVSFEGNASGVWFQLPMKLITRGETGSGRSIRPEAVGDLDGVSLGGSLALAGRGSVSGLSQKARAILSYLPYNSHRQDGIYTSDKRVAIVAEPVPVGSPVVLTLKPSRSS